MAEPFPPASVWQRVSRDVFEAFLAAAFILSGVSGLVAPQARAESIVRALPAWAQCLWYAGLLVGGGLTVVGIVRGYRVGLELRRVGLLTLGGLTASYSVASASLAGERAVTGAILLALLAVACAVRGLQLGRDIALVRAELRPDP